MNEQPEALRCAEALERAIKQIDAEDNVVHVARWFAEEAAAEREACIRACDSVNVVGADECLAAIRARGEKK